MAFNAYPNSIPQRQQPIAAMDGIRADDGFIYTLGRDGVTVFRRRYGVIAIWGVWEPVRGTNEIAAFERAVTAEIESALPQMTIIGTSAADDLEAMVNG